MSNTPQCSAMRPSAQRKMWDLLPGYGSAGRGDAGRERGAGVGAARLDADSDQVPIGQDRAEGRGDVGEGCPHGQHGGDELLPAALPDARDVVVAVVVGQHLVGHPGVALCHQPAVQP